MTHGPTARTIQHLRSLALADADALTDGHLLELFVSRADEVAFEALVRRYGPMVLGVCRRVLGDGPDAEDAFQATFLVLVRKAASIVPRALVGNWLYGVAFRTASKARAMNAKRRAKEAQVPDRPAPDAHEELFWRDLLPVLDQELAALPDKYRTPIVLCDLQGKARKEAAQQLGWPEGTLSSRLAIGRQRLAHRLSRRGVSQSVLALPLVFQNTAPVAAPLLAGTVQAGMLAAAGATLADAGISAVAATLVDGVIKGMLLSKLKLASAVVFTMCLAGAGLIFEAAPSPRLLIRSSVATEAGGWHIVVVRVVELGLPARPTAGCDGVFHIDIRPDPVSGAIVTIWSRRPVS